MAKLKLPLAALFAAAVFASPAVAQEFYAGPAPGAVYANGPAYAYGYRAYGYGCVPAPRVGAFASQPWENDIPCD